MMRAIKDSYIGYIDCPQLKAVRGLGGDCSWWNTRGTGFLAVPANCQLEDKNGDDEEERVRAAADSLALGVNSPSPSVDLSVDISVDPIEGVFSKAAGFIFYHIDTTRPWQFHFTDMVYRRIQFAEGGEPAADCQWQLQAWGQGGDGE